MGLVVDSDWVAPLKADPISETMTYLNKFGCKIVTGKQFTSPKRTEWWLSKQHPCPNNFTTMFEHSPSKQSKWQEENAVVVERMDPIMKGDQQPRIKPSKEHPKPLAINMDVDDDQPNTTDCRDCSQVPHPFILALDIPIMHPAARPAPTNCNRFRARLPSDCESEDSFIVFEGASEDEESQDTWDGECSDSDTEIDQLSDVCDTDSGCLSSLRKRVHFASDKDLCAIHPMVQWSYAYQTARKGPWEQYARDRERFKQRVHNTAQVLSTILEPLHRSRIFEQRHICSSTEKS